METLQKLLIAGYLEEDDRIIWKRKKFGERHVATIKADGSIETADSVVHKTLSGAAKHYSMKPVDGWLVWRLERTGESLAIVRERASIRK